jgi:hypothetical protein
MDCRKSTKLVFGIMLIAAHATTWSMDNKSEAIATETQAPAEIQIPVDTPSEWFPSLTSDESRELLEQRMKNVPLFQGICKTDGGHEVTCIKILRNFSDQSSPSKFEEYCKFVCRTTLSHVDPFKCAEERVILTRLLEEDHRHPFPRIWSSSNFYLRLR